MQMIERAKRRGSWLKDTTPYTQQQAHLRIEHQMCSVLQAMQTLTLRVSNKTKRQVPPTSSAIAISEWDILTATD